MRAAALRLAGLQADPAVEGRMLATRQRKGYGTATETVFLQSFSVAMFGKDAGLDVAARNAFVTAPAANP